MDQLYLYSIDNDVFNTHQGTPQLIGQLPVTEELFAEHGDTELAVEFVEDTELITVYTYYGPNLTLETYTVTFDSNGGSAIPDQEVLEDAIIIRPEDPELEDFFFDGWYSNEALTLLWNFYTGTVTADITLYAKWSDTEPEPLETYTVTFDSNGGSAIPDQEVEENATIVKPTDPTLTDMFFDGWFRDIDLEIPWLFSIDVVTEDITLYAKWSDTVQPIPGTVSRMELQGQAVWYGGVVEQVVDFDVPSIDSVFINVTSYTAGATLKVLVSVDEGASWWTLAGLSWLPAQLDDIAVDGTIYTFINGLTKTEWTNLLGGSNKLRLAYYVEVEASTDSLVVEDIRVNF